MLEQPARVAEQPLGRYGVLPKLSSKPSEPRTGRDGSNDCAVKLGFAVKVLGDGGLPSHDTRRWQSKPHLSVSVGYLDAIFDYLARADIRMYRMSSSLAPYATHPDLTQFRGQVEGCAEALRALGAKARDLGLRLSVHPGQFVVLNSEDADVRALAIADLEVQAEILDAMELSGDAVVVLHVGGARGGAGAAADRFLAGFEKLSTRARARLVIENDDRSFSLGTVMGIAERIGVPVVWDILHHHCHDPERIPDRQALELALSTWPSGITPKIHYSSPKTATDERTRRSGRRVERSVVMPQLRAHADLIDPIGFEHFLGETARDFDFDVMLEAKAKNLALLRLRDQLAARHVDVSSKERSVAQGVRSASR